MARLNEQQLITFLVENQARFYRLAYSYLKNREEALDAVQTAVCRALEKQQSLQEPGAMHTWFYRVLVNTGDDAGQVVHHVHVHVLGGAPMNDGNPSAR